MLSKFTVNNFRGFMDEICFDFGAKAYSFNQQIVRNGLVNKAIVYGKNGIGKSNLGEAIFDIIYHLSDNKKFDRYDSITYLNLDSKKKYATFSYEFKFGNDTVYYNYKKANQITLLTEELYFNDELIISVDYTNYKKRYINQKYIKSLNTNIDLKGMSLVKYIYRNADLSELHLLSTIMTFINNMLWFRRLSEGNSYAGYSNTIFNFDNCLAKHNSVHEFQEFLSKYGLEYELLIKEINGINQLFANYRNAEVPFSLVASTGTMTLYLFYVWKLMAFSDVSFVFIDEFDAFLHYEASSELVKILNSNESFQSVLTTHNVTLMNNKTTRPDACYIMSKNRISCLADCTDKEIREAHNLEKMYKNGAFNE